MTQAIDQAKVSFHCVKCRAVLRAPLRRAGRQVRCPECKTINDVPHGGQAMAPPRDEVALPDRVAHAKYGDFAEAAAAAEPPRRRGLGPVAWSLIIANAVVLLIVLTAIVLSLTGG